jgi:hypothetical protein
MFYSVPTNHNCLCVYSESVPRSRATLTNMYNLMHMWHHVTNHLITSNDKDSNSENRIKLRVRDIRYSLRCIKGSRFRCNEIVEFPPLHFPLFVQRETLN